MICRSKVVKVCFKRKRFFVQIRPDWVRILSTKKNLYLNCAIPNRLQKISLIFFILLEALVLIAFITVIIVTLLLLINACILIIQVYLINDFFFQNEWTDNVIGFHMPTYRACKTLWKTCVEYHTFYRLVLNPGEMITTFQHNMSQHCWVQHVAGVWRPCCDMLRHVVCRWLKFENGQIFHATFVDVA